MRVPNRSSNVVMTNNFALIQENGSDTSPGQFASITLRENTTAMIRNSCAFANDGASENRTTPILPTTSSGSNRYRLQPTNARSDLRLISPPEKISAILVIETMVTKMAETFARFSHPHRCRGRLWRSFVPPAHPVFRRSYSPLAVVNASALYPGPLEDKQLSIIHPEIRQCSANLMPFATSRLSQASRSCHLLRV